MTVWVDRDQKDSTADERGLRLGVPLLSATGGREKHHAATLIWMLVADVCISSMALRFLRNDISQDDDMSVLSPCVAKFAYAVIIVSALRVSCFILSFRDTTTVRLSWGLCVASVCLTSVATTLMFPGDVRSGGFALYLSVQMWLGCVEHRVSSMLRKQREPSRCVRVGPRVLVVSDYTPPQQHGIASHTNGMVTALREKGCFVKVFSTNRVDGDESVSLTWSITNPWNKNVRLSLFPSIELLNNICTGDYDVLHLVCPSLIAWPVLVVAWLAGVPVYVSQHVHERLGSVYMAGVLFYMAHAAYFLWSTLPVCIFATITAGPTTDYVSTHYIYSYFSKECLAVVPSSVDHRVFHADGRDADRKALQQRLGLDERRRIWLLVSRLAPEKDVPELLTALKFHVESWPNEGPESPVLVIAGDGPDRGALELQAKEGNLPVYFLGFQKQVDIASLYRACDVCVTNSVHETFGLTVIEALASGCPMVMPHCSVFDELYGNVLGDWMYHKNDVESLALALRTGSQMSAREKLAHLRRNKMFNKNLFWSWTEAMEEQMDQYQRAQAMVQAKQFRLGFIMRTLLCAITSLVLLSVARMMVVVIGAKSGKHLHALGMHTVLLAHRLYREIAAQ